MGDIRGPAGTGRKYKTLIGLLFFVFLHILLYFTFWWNSRYVSTETNFFPIALNNCSAAIRKDDMCFIGATCSHATVNQLISAIFAVYRCVRKVLSWLCRQDFCKKKVAFHPLSAAFNSPHETNVGFS